MAKEHVEPLVKIVIEVEMDKSVVSNFAEHIRSAADDMRAEGESHPPSTQRYNLLRAARRLRASVKGL